MRKTSPFAILATTLIGASSFMAACEDDESTSNPSSGGSSQGGEGTGGSNGGSAGTAGVGTGGTSGNAGSGASGAATGGRGGTGDEGGMGGEPDTGGGGTGTGGDPGGASGAGGGPEGGSGGAPACGIEAVSVVERDLLERLGPLPAVPPDTTNQYADNAAARTFGQRLFFDKRFSGALGMNSDLGMAMESGKVACSSCHLGESMEDHRSMPPQVSIAAGTHTRNAPGVVNSMFYAWTNWGGRFSAQWELPLPVSESPVLMNGTRLAIAHRIASHYKADYEPIFGALDPELGTTSTRFPPTGKPNATMPGAWENMAQADRDIVMRVFVNFGKALQAYMRQMTSRNAPFDQWVAGDCDAINESAQRGALIFVGKGRCTNCHSGSHFSDDGFHNLGVPQGVPPNPDQGRFADAASLLGASAITAATTPWTDDAAEGTRRRAGLTNPMPESARGAFRTPNLRGVAETGPYMHSGQFASLEDVVDFYNNGGGSPVVGTRDPLIVPLGLTVQEGADLVAFLRTLSGETIPAALLTDTSAGQ